jgi:hypothetical protein
MVALIHSFDRLSESVEFVYNILQDQKIDGEKAVKDTVIKQNREKEEEIPKEAKLEKSEPIPSKEIKDDLFKVEKGPDSQNKEYDQANDQQYKYIIRWIWIGILAIVIVK